MRTDKYGVPIGKAHRNPTLDTRKCKVELENGETVKIMSNQIYANLYSQLDNECHEILKFKGIIDHNKNGSALTKETGFTVIKGRHEKSKPTTCGWKVLVEWQDENTTWRDLKDVKDSSPIELDEYEVSNKIDDEPYFAWLVHYIFKKQNRIIGKDNTKY